MVDRSGRHSEFLTTRYFGSLDGLRCLSIVAVVWHHTAGAGYEGGLLSRGHYGVGLFFAISGFLITTLLLREKDRYGRISLKKFYMRRSLRIFPAYYLVIGIYLVLVLLRERDSVAGKQFISNLPFFLTYTSNWFVELHTGGRVIFYFAWSLATEEQFYLFWPFIVASARHWWIAALAMAGLWGLDFGLELAGYVSHAVGVPLGMRIITSIASPICLGCLAALFTHRAASFGVIDRLAGRWWSPPLGLVLMGVSLWFDDVPPVLIDLAMTYLVLACCVTPKSPLTPVLAHGSFRYVGTISYGMYLLHMLALNVIRRVSPSQEPYVLFPLALLLTIGLAAFTHRYFESYFLKLKDRFSSERPTPGR